ncbi:MAG: leucine zipper domain-containing protein [Actinomycetota bacterium]
MEDTNKWACRYWVEGPAGMIDRSSRPHHQPSRAGHLRRWWAGSCTCDKDRLGRSRSVADSRFRPRRCTRCWSGTGSTVSPTSIASQASRSAATKHQRPGT